MVGECHPIRKSQQMVTSQGGELLHESTQFLKHCRGFAVCFQYGFHPCSMGRGGVCPAWPAAPSPQLVAPGQGRCFERAATWPSTQNRTVVGAGAAPVGGVSCCSVRLPGEESASVLNTPDCQEQCAADDSTATSQVASPTRQGLGEWVGVMLASLVLPSQRPSVSFTHAISTGCRPRLRGTHG